MLRANVQCENHGPTVHLKVAGTAFAVVLDGTAAELVRAEGRSRAEQLAIVRENGASTDAELELDGFWAELAALGLLEDGRAEDDPDVFTQRALARERDHWALLDRAVAFAADNTSFHSRLRGVDVKPGPTWSAAPIMSRADLRAQFPEGVICRSVDLAAEIASGRVALSATSGTTDERVQVASVIGPGAADSLLRELVGLPGAVRFRRGAVLTTPLCSATACHLGDSTLEQRTAGVTTFLTSSTDLMTMSDSEVRRVVEELHAVAPDVFFVHPWYAVYVGQRARAMGIALPQIGLVLTTYQFPTVRHRRLLRDLYGGEVKSFYSATEAGGYLIGCECVHGNLHVRQDHVHVDLHPTRAVSSRGALCQVLVTTLVNEVMPLVRYNVGDLARATPPCRCAWGAVWPTLQLEGRAKDCLLDSAGQIVTLRMVDEAIGDADIDFYSVTQITATRYRLEAIAAVAGAPQLAADRLAKLLGPAAILELRLVARFTPERSLKFRQVRVEGVAERARIDDLTTPAATAVAHGA